MARKKKEEILLHADDGWVCGNLNCEERGSQEYQNINNEHKPWHPNPKGTEVLCKLSDKSVSPTDSRGTSFYTSGAALALCNFCSFLM